MLKVQHKNFVEMMLMIMNLAIVAFGYSDAAVMVNDTFGEVLN